MSDAQRYGISRRQKNGTPDRRKIAKDTLTLFLPGLALTLAVTAAILFASGSTEMRVFRSEERQTVALQAANIDRDILEVSSDLALLAHGRTMGRLWADDGLPISSVLADLTQDFLDISRYRQLYDQVRLLDEKGMEIVRVNFNNGRPAVVPQEKLQNKKGRYYFDDAFRLSRGKVFVSPLDLNVEHGEIEQPLAPMLRFATPVFDGRGEKRGIVLLNYFGAKMLGRFSSQADMLGVGQAMLLNADGYWLEGPNPEDEWGFMYEDRKDRTFASAHPEAWERIKSDENCQFEMAQGMFTSKTVHPLLGGQKSSTGSGEAFSPSTAQLEGMAYSWKVVSFAPHEVLYADRNRRRMYAALAVALLASAMFVGVWLVARAAALREQSEVALRVRDQQYHSMLQSAMDGFWVVDAGGRILDVNETCCQMLGYDRQEILAMSIPDIEAIESPEDTKQHIQKVIETGYERFETRHRRKDGKLIDVEVSTIYLSDVGGRLYSFLRDVTDRKRAREERGRLMLAIDHSAEMVVITDAEGDIQYVNPAFEQVTGYSREEAIGKNPRILKSGEHDDVFYREMWGTLTGGETWRGRIVNRRKDGTLFTEETTISPVHEALSGRTVNYVAVKRDVTHEAYLEEALRQGQKMEAIGTLAGGIAHDFNNILAAIMGYAEILQDEFAQGDPPTVSSVDEILKAGERAKALVNQILAFGRKTKIERIPLRAGSVVKEALKLLREVLPSTVEVRQNIVTDSDTVLADPTQIHQIAMNLCTNAWQAMRETGGVLEVRMGPVELDSESAELHPGLEPGPYLELTVRDTGMGIEKEDLDRIFEPFFTTKSKGEGTGMGLAVVHGAVKGSGGAIAVESEVGKGTSFQVLLPRLTTDADPAADEAAELNRGTERVLFVDDEEALLKAGAKMLLSLGYHVTARENGALAYDVFAARPDDFDLVLTDLTMPGGTGLELAGRILAARPDIPILLYTGHSDLITPTKAKEIGIQDVLTKPLSKHKLALAVRRALDRDK